MPSYLTRVTVIRNEPKSSDVFGALVVGSFFAYKGCLCIKVGFSFLRTNALALCTDEAYTLSDKDMVEFIPKVEITIPAE